MLASLFNQVQAASIPPVATWMTEYKERRLMSRPEQRCFYPGYIERRQLRKDTLLIYTAFEKKIQDLYLLKNWFNLCA